MAEDRQAGKVVKVILMKCSSTKIVLGHVVPCKGVDESMHVVKLLVEDIKWLGHTRMLLKCDNERAVVRLVREALKEARLECSDAEQIGKEHPEAYDSAANGLVENAVRNVKAHCRTLKMPGAADPEGDPSECSDHGLDDRVLVLHIQRQVARRGRTHGVDQMQGTTV